MKLKISLLIFGYFISINVFAQKPEVIEHELVKSFKKFEYWNEKSHTNADEYSLAADDSLEATNKAFGIKLKEYATKYPGTISQPFKLLKKEKLKIFSSNDGLFRIYSWETWLGGTMSDFANVFQYKVGQKTQSTYIHSETPDDNYTSSYSKLYTFKVKQKTYYLGIYNEVYSNKNDRTGVQIFDIENGKLNNDVKIIKTASGLHSKLYYDYDFLSVVDIPYGKRPTIYFDAATQTIHVPVVVDKGKVTNRYITYKFTGQYFEKVK